MAPDQHGFDPYPGTIKYPDFSSFVGETADWDVSTSTSVSAVGDPTVQKVFAYEGEQDT